MMNDSNITRQINGVERVKSVIDNQQKKGLKKYGSFVRYDALTLVEWLRHFQEELADALIYSQMAIENLEKESEIKKEYKTIEKRVNDYCKTYSNSSSTSILHDMARIQNDLDSFIIKSCNLQINKAELLKKLEIAFAVEAFELMNECRESFKYWSRKKNDWDKILEEYIDGVHFLLSMANHRGQTDEVIEQFVRGLELPTDDETPPIFEFVRRSVTSNDLLEKALCYGTIGHLLHFNIHVIYDAYLEKNKENYKRQKTGY